VTVLVVGATGTVGPHVDRALAARREPARVLARDAGHARAALPADTDIRDLVTKADQPFQVISLPEMVPSMHGQDPQLFTSLLAGWARRLDTP
jgi:nucleoside-diphosphate-sugar epimerase